jgi:hypothetical protein
MLNIPHKFSSLLKLWASQIMPLGCPIAVTKRPTSRNQPLDYQGQGDVGHRNIGDRRGIALAGCKNEGVLAVCEEVHRHVHIPHAPLHEGWRAWILRNCGAWLLAAKQAAGRGRTCKRVDLQGLHAALPNLLQGRLAAAARSRIQLTLDYCCTNAANYTLQDVRSARKSPRDFSGGNALQGLMAGASPQFLMWWWWWGGGGCRRVLPPPRKDCLFSCLAWPGLTGMVKAVSKRPMKTPRTKGRE